jgi:hypothetical protein
MIIKPIDVRLRYSILSAFYRSLHKLIDTYETNTGISGSYTYNRLRYNVYQDSHGIGVEKKAQEEVVELNLGTGNRFII